jgi:chemosensory pili system protein ChpA (sensor histidine kinase/response regulator)
MNTRAEFDVGPLSWVKGEIDQSLARALDALRQFAADTADTGLLKSSQANLHQAHGALQIVGLDGVTRVSEEIESFLSALERDAVPRSEENFGLAGRGFAALSGYLDQLVVGMPNLPLRLFGVYRELLAARGLQADPSDLYFPDLSRRPSRHAAAPVQSHQEDAAAYLREQRGRFQRGLLKWIKKDASGPHDMREAISAIEATQQQPAQRAFWWVAAAFCDALAHDALPPSLDAKRMCMRIEQQLKRLIEGSPLVAERLIRETLYFVAHAAPASDLLREVRHTYALEGSIPDGDDAAPTALPEQPLVRALHEQVSQAKDAWNKYASGHQPSLTGFRDLAGQIRTGTAQLPKADIGALASRVAAVADWLAGGAQKSSEAVAMEVATALLLLDNALENYSGVGAEFAQQAQLMGSRLEACVLGKPPASAPAIPLLDEMSRRAQERLALHQVVAEIQANLRVIEQTLDGFFRDAAKRSELAALDKPIRQVLGALSILGETRASELLGSCRGDVARFASDDYVPQAEDFERVAQALSGLGFYMESLAHGKADFDTAMQPIKPSVPETPMERTQRLGGSVEAELEQQQKDAATLFEAWKDKPDDAAIKQELRQNLQSIQKDAGLVADARLETQAGEALSMLDKSGAMPHQPLAEAIEGIVPGTAAPEPSAETTKLIDATDETVDAELLAVYLEEADEVLASIAAHVATSEAQPQNQEALTVIRRGFHTLKGSGRMVGLTRLGEAAWAVEQVINHWLQDARAATPQLTQLVRAAHDYFRENVARLKNGGSSSDEHALVALAARVKDGDSADAEAPATAAMAGEVAAAEATADETPLHELDTGGVAPTFEASAAPALPELAEVPESSGAVGVPVETEAPADAMIEIGEIRVSRTLYGIFVTEASAHLDVMRAELDVLKDHSVVSDALLRASHTLAGIAGTIRLDDMRELGHALERALQQLSYDSVSEYDQALVAEAVATLDAMATRVAECIPPDAAPELIERLETAAIAAAQNAQTAASAATAAATRIRALEPDAAEAAVEKAGSSAVLEFPAAGGAPAQSAAPESAVPAAVEAEQIETERRQPRMEDDLDPQLLPVFLEEAGELVPSIGNTLRAWRAEPSDASLGQNLQRLLHTLKGSARMAGAMGLGELTHHMETRIENAVALGSLPASLFDGLETSLDRMGYLYDRLQNPSLLEPAAEQKPADATPAVVAEDTAPVDDRSTPAPAETAQAVAAPRDAEGVRAGVLRVRADVIDRLVNQAGEVSIARTRIEGEMRVLKAALQELTDNMARLRTQLREVEIQAETQMQSKQQIVSETKEGFDALEFDRFSRFQELTRMMAESVNDVGTVHQNLTGAIDETDAALAAQSRMSRDLQQDLMRIRMVPFSSIGDRLYRIVRQTAKELGKRANLDIRGGQIEMDRSVLERITAPFEHLLRNAITHGLESTEARRAAGKEETGEIRLDLRQEGNDVVLALTDDGAGLNLPRIREKAMRQGLMTPEDQPSDGELAEFIFRPGFSTAEDVTQLAGRGVGMDVVKSEVVALGGRVEIKTESGKGAKFTLYLPLTLAVTQAVLVRAGGRMFAVPGSMVEQVMQLRPKDIAVAHESGHAELHNRRYALHYLPRLLALPETAAAEPRRTTPLLFVRSGIDVVAVEVDEMVGNQEIVVKNVGPQIAGIAGITGATVLGNGDIVLILNPVILAQRAQLAAAAAAASVASGEAQAPALPVVAPPVEEAAAPVIMVVDDSLTVRKVTGRLLAREGYQFVTAKDGVDALEQLQTAMPAVMLVDIEMPRMDGFDLARNVRADARLKHIPIIMITSRMADKHRAYAKEIGVNVYLGKPFQEDELLGHIAAFIKARG